MFIPEYIHNINEGLSFCDRYGITCSVNTTSDGKEELVLLNPPDLSYNPKFKTVESIARKIDGFVIDHPNAFLNDQGHLIVTFSPYDGELRESEQKKLRRKGYDIQLCEFDLYGYGTKTYVMAELVSPLDVVK